MIYMYNVNTSNFNVMPKIGHIYLFKKCITSNSLDIVYIIYSDQSTSNYQIHFPPPPRLFTGFSFAPVCYKNWVDFGKMNGVTESF